MQLRFTVLFLLIIFSNNQSTSAQSLTQRLLAEDATKLVQQARKDGDIVRGAILFHQGNINCAKCHRPSAEKDRIGPDLSRLNDDVTDISVVESILLPSKEIKKEYETATVLTLQGNLVDGMIVKDDGQFVIIRDRENVDNLITIAHDEIDEVKPGKFSTMPSDLADELKDRKQFLDLLRYVLDIKDRGPESASVIGTATNVRELDSELEGLISIQKYNCTACHSETREFPGAVLAAKQAPNLAWSAKNLNPTYLHEFIADPHSKKIDSSMPDLFGGLDDRLRQKSAAAITNYLVSKAKNEFRIPTIDKQAASRGFTVFHSVGCVACHSPRDRMGKEKMLPGSTEMGKLAGKYSIDALVNFLEEPTAVRSSGHMPNMQLSRREATDISNFLLQASPGDSQKFETDAALIEKGKSLFVQMNCLQCHSKFEPDAKSELEFVAVNQLDLNKGCLSDEVGVWPKFSFAENEIANIRLALKMAPESLTHENQINLTLRSYNCIACHSRNELGGVPMDRNHLFTTTNLNLGDQGRLPPTLTGVGTKLKPKWTRDVLVNRRSIRPYMNTRMPQYGEQNVGHLVELFESTDLWTGSTSFAEFKDQKETRKWGLDLAGNKGLNCVACHTYKYKLSDTMPAVDLTEMAQRLKKEWFYNYMLDPQQFSPNTVMPSFWPGGKAIRADIKGTPEDQVEALWQYLLDGRQAGTPRGVVREPLEIVVTDEAQMLRRKYPGIGKRGIGVGYPGGINLAFDAEQIRLAMVWSGKFADPGGVWTGQGSGQVRPMGRTINFAKGPDVDQSENPWIVDDGRPPNHKFKGYRLDKLQRPTFLYEINGTKVQDYFIELNPSDDESVGLTRVFTLSGSKQQKELRVRLASGTIKKIENGYAVDDRLTVEVLSHHTATIDDEYNPAELRVPISLTDQNQKLEIRYTWK